MPNSQNNDLSKKPLRLSDRILDALELALDQEDTQTAEHLVNAMELAMTRQTGGSKYVERREYPERVDSAIDRFHDLKRKKGLE